MRGGGAASRGVPAGEGPNKCVHVLRVHRALVSLRAPDDEHGTLRGQIEQLKTGLEHEQMLRKRKMEYDFVAEKVNTLPTREELEQCVIIPRAS